MQTTHFMQCFLHHTWILFHLFYVLCDVKQALTEIWHESSLLVPLMILFFLPCTMLLLVWYNVSYWDNLFWMCTVKLFHIKLIICCRNKKVLKRVRQLDLTLIIWDVFFLSSFYRVPKKITCRQVLLSTMSCAYSSDNNTKIVVLCFISVT